MRAMPQLATAIVRLLLAGVLTLSTAAAQQDFYVNGQTGQDIASNGSSPQSPWKTITYALTQITPPSWPAQNTLNVAGGQVYSPATNGETFPIQPIYNTRIIGPAANPPVLQLAAGVTGIRFDPNTVYNRDQSKIDGLAFRGGQYGILMGGTAAVRHRPKVDRCTFDGQSVAGIYVGQNGQTICDPRFFKCRFTGPALGIWAVATGSSAVVRPDIEECLFDGLGQDGVFIQDQSLGGSDVGGLVRYCWFVGCRSGVVLFSGLNAYFTRCDVMHCTFHSCRRFGVHTVIGLPADPDVTIEECTFTGGEAGVYCEGNLSPGSYTFNVRNNVARFARHAGFEYSFNGTGNVRIVSENNLAADCLGAGHLVWLISPSVNLTMDSLRDRALRNQAAGFNIALTSPSQDSLILHSCMAAGNGGDGVLLAGAENVEMSCVTSAANGGSGLAVSGAWTGTAADHCIFAANGSGEIAVPSGFPITWSCLQNQSYAGTGNMQANPLLLPPQYKLHPTSPCIDAGNRSARVPALDFEDDVRPQLGRLGSQGGPDMGADERNMAGNLVLYGNSGFGADGFHPHIASPNTAVHAGQNLVVDLRDAADFWGFLAQSAFLMIGLAEDEGALGLFDLQLLGAPGSYLWQDLALTSGLLPVIGNGTASVTIPIPPGAIFIGATVTAQWWVAKMGINAAGFVTTEGLRITIAQ